MVLDSRRESRESRRSSEATSTDHASVKASPKATRADWARSVWRDPWKLALAPPEIIADRHIVINTVKREGLALEHASEEFRKDKSIVLEAVKQDGEALKFASEELRHDADVVRAAIRNSCWALRHTAEGTRRNRKVMLEAMQQRWWAVDLAEEALKADPSFWSEALSHGGDSWMAFAHASLECRGDPDLVMQAVGVNGMALKYASETLRSDRDFVLEAVKQDWRALLAVGPEPRADREVVLEAARQSLQDQSLFVELSEQHPRALAQAPDPQREDVLRAVRANPLSLAYADSSFRGDRELVNEAIRGTIGSCSGLLWRAKIPKLEFRGGTAETVSSFGERGATPVSAHPKSPLYFSAFRSFARDGERVPSKQMRTSLLKKGQNAASVKRLSRTPQR